MSTFDRFPVVVDATFKARRELRAILSPDGVASRVLIELAYAELFRRALEDAVPRASDEVNPEEWPDSAIKLAMVVGVDGALALCRHLGGRRAWYIPRKPTQRSAFLQVLGVERMAALSAVYGGQKLDVPTLAFARRSRKQLAIELLGCGLSKRAIAARVGCTEGYVQTIAALVKEDA